MRIWHNYRFFLSILLVVFVGCLAYAQSTHGSFDKAAMQAYLENPEFDYSQKYAPSGGWFTLLLAMLLTWIFETLGETTSVGSIYFLIKIGAFIIVGIGLYLLFRLKYGHAFRSEHKMDEFSPILGMEAAENTNYSALCKESLANDQLDLASRYLYLSALQKLAAKDKIKLSKWKTARDYTYEVEGDDKKCLTEIMKMFESSWFGNQSPSSTAFENIYEQAKQLDIA